MNNEKNDSNNGLDSQPHGETPQNQYDFSESAHSLAENSNINSEEKIPLPEETNQGSQPIETKKKNPYKIAFYALGSVIILGSASFFGYKYMKQKEIPVEINQCLDTDTKVYDAYKDAVVLIKHQYGYFAKINGKEFQLTVPEATEETIYGTGFFIDREGSLLTNTHVLQPWSSNDAQNEKIQTNISNMRMKIASILTTDISEDGYESFILRNWENASANQEEEEGEYSENDGESENNSGEEFVTSSDSQIDSTTAVTDIAASIPQKEYISGENIEVYMKTIDISVALHDSNEEWLNCNIVKISDDANIDLGILQLLDKKTPESVTNIINMDNMISDDKSLKPGEKAIMIGYPLGVDLAQTNSGIKVQLYNGQISKESDGNKIQYSITSTHGASGAPVFNKCGQLIAVNFSGVDEIQGFNFGIVAKQINTIFKTNVGEIKSNN
ncbi:serine protease [Chryseobacterium sp. PBS4-4]|uniref:Serine protease n=1 Tax=Chryseobacterium edaphi TaxID=2976532 RepID=A0ABT2W375_9FLAO|nr:serine protease [Chryseobacterium edaphi]MCU7616676.1 serine protease [Chryseobacterium edaphi]